MRSRTCSRSIVLFLPLACAVLGCAYVNVPLDLTSLDPTSDQRMIGDIHRREAVFFKFKAREQAQRMLVYEGLFGADSDWVKGARLLERFYEEAAIEQERLAGLHVGLAGHEQRPLRHVQPTIP